MVNRSGVPWPVTPKQGDGVQPKAPPKIVTLVDDGDVTFLLNDFKSGIALMKQVFFITIKTC